ncbi:MAG TPA: LytTR family DNA-binding domain-containing protein [Bacteroidota bacterium]
MNPIRVIAVDDEPASLQALRAMLADRKDVEIIREISQPSEAIQEIKKQKPDVLFLDIQMPGMSGFQLIEQIKSEDMPIVVFVTAYDRYAVKAFDAHALDYILKPYGHNRLEETLTRVKEHLARKEQYHQYKRIEQLIESMRSETSNPPRFLVKKKDKVIHVKPEDIDWIEASGNYVRLKVRGEGFLLRERISVIEKKLPKRNFIRVHRSMIVNLDRIKELVPIFQRDFTLVLNDGTKIKLGRTYAEEFFKLMKAL